MDVLDYARIAPQAVRPLFAAGAVLADSGLERPLLTLVQLRASQLNGCAFCLALHWREAEALGERGDRLSGLPAWREAPWYTDRERAALEWTEGLTQLDPQQPPDALRERVRAHFSDEELVYLTLAVITINAWNRFNVGFGMPPDRADGVFRQLFHSGAAAAG